MYAATLGFDVDRYASEQFRDISQRNGTAMRRTKSLRFMVSSFPKSIIEILGALVDSIVVKSIQSDIQRIKQSALIFRGLRDDLKEKIDVTGVAPSPEVLRAIDRAQSSLVNFRSIVKSSCFVIREYHENSRVAAAFDALSHEVNELMTAVYRFRLVAIGADLPVRTWEETTAASSLDLLAATNSIDDMSEAGIDGEIYALSLALIEQAERHVH